jgi:hypothetical protein
MSPKREPCGWQHRRLPHTGWASAAALAVKRQRGQCTSQLSYDDSMGTDTWRLLLSSTLTHTPAHGHTHSQPRRHRSTTAIDFNAQPAHHPHSRGCPRWVCRTNSSLGWQCELVTAAMILSHEFWCTSQGALALHRGDAVTHGSSLHAGRKLACFPRARLPPGDTLAEV